jgi:hypothetical protein
VPAAAPEPMVVPGLVPAAVGAVSGAVAAQEHAPTGPNDVVRVGEEPNGGAAPHGVERWPDAALPADQASPSESFAADTPLPTEVRLQDLAARQRSSTADLRRSIRDVIERLDDDEPPASRRRGKKPRR